MKGIITIIATIGVVSASTAYSEDALVSYKSPSPDLAVEVAMAALKRCRNDGYQVAVVVMDRFGHPQVLVRDRFAGLPASETASDKAYTALGFRSDTGELEKEVQAGRLNATLGVWSQHLMVRI